MKRGGKRDSRGTGEPNDEEGGSGRTNGAAVKNWGKYKT